MLFNRKGINQKNWRMVKKGKHFLFGCTLFLATGAIGLQQTQVVRADEVASSVVTSMNSAEDGEDRDKGKTSKEEVIKQEDNEINLGVTSPLSKKSDELDKKEDVAKTEVNKRSLIELIEKIKNIDLSKKTIDSVEKLNLSLSRVQQLMESPTVSQEEVDKEEKALKESFEKLEDKPEKEKASESREKAEPQKEEKSDLSKEKITKVTETVNEIHSLANQINYEFSDTEKELVKTAEKLSEDSNREDEVESLLKEVTRLRNKVANRMTRAHSGKRDPRNGQPIAGNGESGFRAVYFLPTQNQHGRGEAGLVKENRTDLTYYNSDEIYSFMRVLGQRGPGEPLYKYQYGEKRGEEDGTPYYLKTVGVISGLDKLKGITLRVAYKNPRTGKEDFQDITSGAWPVNNPEVKAVIRGWLGRYDKTGEAVEPGDYRVTIAAGRKNPENSITYTFHVKAQSERNTVNDLATPTYVDDVRHLTEAEKTDLIKKFEAAHPGVVKRPVHVDYDHAEVSADGATMTIHFKDGFAPKTIQTNAQNDAIAKHQSITALYGDPHDFYKNPRNLVKSKTGNELPSTVDVTWKTPFNLQQSGTRNAVVTVTYQNGAVKDVSTPYTVLDFVGKQDKRINQHQSGELGDARSYITLSNGTAPATDLTIRWKGGSTVDTSRPTVHHKQIEILRGNTTMKTVDIPVEIVDNIRPTVEIPYDNPGNQEIYLYSHENNNITLKAKDNNGKVSKVYLAFAADNRQGLGQEDSSYLGGGSPDGLYLTATKIKSETTGSDAQPATITVSGNINNQPFTGEKSITRYLYTEDPAGNANYEHVGHANDNGAPGRIRFVWKPQTFKYTATANSQTQTVSYKDEPSAEANINKTGLPSGTTYAWKTKPDTSSPGNKSGVVEVTYPDTSKDTVNVTVSVRKLSDEYAPTGNKIVRNQNVPITNNDLKAAVAISNNGNSKVKSVTAGTISTANAGTQTIKATVTYLDNTTDPVDIPLEVKDITAPTITTPSDRQNWDLIALDRTLPSIKVAATDNTGGTGVKSTTVTGLPDFLVYDNATKTIKFKNGVQEVTKLPVGQDSKTYTATIQVTDNADNPSQRQFTITVKSMTTKYTATPNVQKQTVSYDVKPDAGTSVNKNGLPAGTTYTWATTPSTTTGPGDKAGVVTVTYPDGSKDTVNVTVNVRAQKDEYTPTAIAQEVDNGHVPDPETSVNKTGLPDGTTVTWKTTPDVSTPGSHPGVALVHYPDGTEDEVEVPVRVKEQKETFNPTAKQPNQKVRHNEVPDPEKSINTNDLPKGTKYSWSEQPDTSKPGSKTGKVLITYPDKSTEEVTVTVEVTPQKDEYTPTAIAQEVDNGHVPDPETSVNKTGLPDGTTVTWKTTPDVSTPGSHPGVALVHYPDGTEDEVEVPVRVKEQKETFNPTAKQPNQKVRHNEVPDPEKSINTNDLPKGTKYSWSEQPDTSKPGSKTGKVLITYPDKSTEEVTVTVEVTPQKDEYTPTAIAQEVDNGHVPDPETSVNKTGLPDGTTVTWKTTPDVSTPGSHPGVALVHYPDGTEDEVEVPVRVKEQKETFNPTAKQPNQKVRHNEVPDPEKSINTNDLPKGTKYSWSEQPDTSKPGSKTGKVLITYPDKSTEEVTVTVEVTPQKDEYTPTAIAQEVDNGHVPDPETSVNKTGLPDGTTVTWKTTPDVSTPGSHPGVALVHYPDGTEDEVEVPVRVKEQKETFNPTAKQPNQKVRHNEVPDPEKSINTNDLPKGTKYSWSEQPDTSKPGSKTGKVLITYPDKSTEEVTVTVEVTPQKDEYTPTAIAQEVDNGHVPDPETSVNKTGLPDGTTVTWKTTPDVSTPGSHPGVALVHYPDGTEDEVEVPVRVKEQKETFNPTAKQPNQKVRHNEVPDPEKSINTNDLPKGTKYSWSEQPDTSKPGSKTGKVLITYPDKSTEEVTVTVEVTPQKDEYTPTAIAQEVDNGHVPDPETSVNKTGLPDGTTVTWKTTPDVSTPGSHPGVALVHYPDGTEDEVEVPVRVKEQKETFNPTAKQPNQKVRHNEVPDPEKSINTNDLPKGTKYSWSEQPDTSKPGSKTGKVLITYPDKSTEEVTVTVEVTPQKDEYTPTAIAQEVDNGHVPDPETSVNKTGLPDGTTVTWKTTPDVSTPGSHPGVALVHYPDGTEDEVEVPVRVKEQKETFNPTAKQPNQKVRHNEVPDPEKSINTNDLPKGTKYSWSEQPDTSKPGSKTGKVLITYPDKSTEEVTVTVEVTPQKDEYDPQPKAQTVDNGTVPEARNSIGNIDKLPPNTRFEWKNGAPSTTEKGDHPGTVLVTYPDGTSEEVEVKVNVRQINANGTPEIQPEAPDFTGGVNTPDAPTNEIPDYTDPIGSTGVDENGNLIVPPIVEAPDFTGGVNAPDAPISEVPEYTDPIGSTGVDENGNLIIPPSVDIPEFMGGTSTPDAPTHEFSEFNGNIAINGELPEPAQLPKVKLIITKWLDENGNELKPADAKTPKVLGEENEAFEHGEIEGYEFVRTEVDENGEVVTHIFRKVTSSGVTQTNDNVKPEQTPDALHVPTNETHAQPEKDEVKQKETQTTLPKTGTANSLGLLSVATSSILFGLGFFILSKKEDEE
ncbi:SIALI-17 repeat-containing surface protein [Streptococcus mitis]|uniref:SIALI-17 repeat-containing surface protein n=1 Tax=Streptococcus mitis TaxID=28037 RepID=UPI000A76D13D|nr:SIALI-17 repeat-containing surface protein [Streptococcus mitis]